MKVIITRSIVLVLGAFILCGPQAFAAAAGEPARIAVLGIHSSDAQNERGRLVRDMLEVMFYRKGAFEILERNRIDVLTGSKGIPARDCIDLDCAVRVGKLLSLDYAVTGTVGGGKDFPLAIRIIDVRRGIVAYAGTVSVPGEAQMEKSVSGLVDRAMEDYSAGVFRSRGEAGTSDFRFNRENVLLTVVPGLYQVKRGHTVKGYTIMGIFSASLCYTGYSIFAYQKSRAAYEDLGPGDDWSTFEKKYNASSRNFILMNVALGLSAAIYLYNWIDAVYFTPGREGESQISLLIEQSGTGTAAGFNPRNGDSWWNISVVYRHEF